MIIDKKVNEVITNNIGETSQAQIKASARIFSFFADQIYSNKYRAIIRELVANGIDSQKVTGETRPPEITFPSNIDPTFTIRDWGTGMSHEFIMGKFMQYTDASTKENSNEFIGGFGIGSKAPLAYTDQFSLRSFQNGEVRTYVLFKDSEGCPCITHMNTTKTDEPDGVEIKFAVRQEDFHKFSLELDVLKYFEPQPLVDGKQLYQIDYKLEGEFWGSNSEGKSQAIIGGVAYHLNLQKLFSNNPDYTNKGLPVDVYFDIGEVNISLSREDITLDASVAEKVAQAQKELEEKIISTYEKKWDDLSRWDAQAALGQELHELSWSPLARILRECVTHQGEPLDFSFNPSGLKWVNTGRKNCRVDFHTKAKTLSYRNATPWSSISPHNVDLVVINDYPKSQRIREKLLREENPDLRILWVKGKKGEAVSKVLDSLGSPSNYKLLSQVDIPKGSPKAAPGAPVTKNLKLYVDSTKLYPGSDAFIEELPKEGGVWVEMSGYSPTSEVTTRWDVVRYIQSLLKDGQRLLFLNKKDIENSGIESKPEWVKFDDYVKKHLDKPKNMIKLKKQYLSLHWQSSLAIIVARVGKHPAFKALEDFQEAVANQTEIQALWCLHAGDTKVTDQDRWNMMEKLDERGEKILKKQPLLAELIRGTSKRYGYNALSFSKEFLERLIK